MAVREHVAKHAATAAKAAGSAVHGAFFSSQGSLITGGIMLAFLVYVTLKGHLGQYLNDLGIGSKAAAAQHQAGAGALGQGAGSAIGNVIGGGGLSIPSIPGIPAFPSIPSIATPPIVPQGR